LYACLSAVRLEEGLCVSAARLGDSSLPKVNATSPSIEPTFPAKMCRESDHPVPDVMGPIQTLLRSPVLAGVPEKSAKSALLYPPADVILIS
jgi:hypothetical protein